MAALQKNCAREVVNVVLHETTYMEVGIFDAVPIWPPSTTTRETTTGAHAMTQDDPPEANVTNYSEFIAGFSTAKAPTTGKMGVGPLMGKLHARLYKLKYKYDRVYLGQTAARKYCAQCDRAPKTANPRHGPLLTHEEGKWKYAKGCDVDYNLACIMDTTCEIHCAAMDPALQESKDARCDDATDCDGAPAHFKGGDDDKDT
ncbi:unnamed protein product [Prorocentrum cordatum]|uniref:Subtilisin n=1 Tax=Prorocentrum cordatum TaxID=2364126 RepID=A0ABN9TTB8_9DINO|nr:unnamed protein product [Polarella glacialis]